MTQEIAYSNGQFIPSDQLLIRPQDMGFMLGVTVAEQLRTFGGQLFEAEHHFSRLRNSLDIVGLSGVETDDLLDAAERVTKHNHALLKHGSDLGVAVFVTPGLSPTYGPEETPQPQVGMHSYPLPFSLWASKYQTGQHCSFVSVPQVSELCWPRALKCRSRMHYYMADREARRQDPVSRAILVDQLGNVNEASTANVIAYFEDKGLVSPPVESILPGVSLAVVERLAAKLGCNFAYDNLAAEDLARADEILLTSTPFCLLPVSQLGARSFVQRDCFQWIMRAWSAQVGFDIEAQAKRFAS